MKTRVNEILNGMNSFKKDLYNKQEVLPELFALQDELVNLTFNDTHAENGSLRIWDVESHLDKLNTGCGHVADELLGKFKSDCNIICNTIKAEKSGQAGEYKAYRSLETLRCKNSVLKNIEFVAEDHRTELDAIVVTEKAIFIVEVKNPGKDIYIDERGNYCRVSDTLIFDKNIGEKMNEKDYLLREALKDCGVENINIQNIVVFTNSAMHVENRFPYINTCYLSDMPHIIGGYNGERIYNDADINNIVNAIETNKCHESYPMPIDMQEFKNDFATLMATLEKASETKEEPVEDEPIQTVAETVEAEEQTKGYHTAVAWFKKHKIASHLVASVAVVALASIAVVSATTKR